MRQGSLYIDLFGGRKRCGGQRQISGMVVFVTMGRSISVCASSIHLYGLWMAHEILRLSKQKSHTKGCGLEFQDLSASLRWHYPGQVLRVVRRLSALAPKPAPGSP